MQAADLLERGVIPAEIARQVGVAHQVVSEWRKAWRQAGREALRSAGPAGRKSKLTDAQFIEISNALTNGAEANGYVTDVWTVPRVAVRSRMVWAALNSVAAADLSPPAMAAVSFLSSRRISRLRSRLRSRRLTV